MLKLTGTAILLASVVACSPSVTKDAAQVAYHHTMSNLIEGCERLGPVTAEYEASWL